MIQIPQMVFEVVEGLALGPIIGVILKIADPSSVFFPIDKLHRVHGRPPPLEPMSAF